MNAAAKIATASARQELLELRLKALRLPSFHR